MSSADVRGSSAGTLGFATTVDPGVLAAASAPVMSGVDDPLADVPTDDEDAAAEASATANDAEPSAGLATLIPAHGAGDGDDSADPGADEAEATPDDDGLDLDAAQRVLGRPIELDDLTAVEGIGPKIAQLCAAIGIDSWRSLAHSDVPTLRSMLDDAGARFKMHKPDSWPEQAALLADGRWEELVALTDRVDSGD